MLFQIKHQFKDSLTAESKTFNEYGTVLYYGDGVAWINGLKSISINELVKKVSYLILIFF